MLGVKVELRVLVVDDEEAVRHLIDQFCTERGIHCAKASSCTEAVDQIRDSAEPFDVILLDIGMPGETGWQFLERIRQEGDETPVIFLSGRTDVQAKVKGLELGADDYIPKPFAGAELFARIEAVLRRRNSLPVLTLADLQVDLAHRTVQRAGERIELSRTEFDVLQCLVEARGGTVSRAQLLEQVWGVAGDDSTTKVVEVSISRLRGKLDRTEPHLIETVVRSGYRVRISAEDGGA